MTGISVFQCPHKSNYWLTNCPSLCSGQLVASNLISLGIKNTISQNKFTTIYDLRFTITKKKRTICTLGTFGVLYEVGKSYHDSKFPTSYDPPNVPEVSFGVMFPFDCYTGSDCIA